MRVHDLQELLDNLPKDTLVHVPYDDEGGHDYVTEAYLTVDDSLLLVSSRDESSKHPRTLWDIDEASTEEEKARRDVRYTRAIIKPALLALGHHVQESNWADGLHVARAFYRCHACGLSAMINVRPAPGAPQQGHAYGPALEQRCTSDE